LVGRQVIKEEINRVERDPVFPHFIVKMRRGGLPCIPHITDDLASQDFLSGFDKDP
jgi:hypothetical protein